MAKTITFNGYESFEHIYTWDGAAFSANLYDATVFDYFVDTAAVDDCTYFGNSHSYKKNTGQGPRNIRVYIGTAFAATSATFVWEYYNGSTWVAIPSLTDNTSGWTVTGEQTIDFVTPRDSEKITINSIEAMWIRCRISAVSGTTEGGANSTQNCRGGNSIISVSGGTDVDPVTLEDIYQADVTGSWGVVSKFLAPGGGQTLYVINACVYFSSGYVQSSHNIIYCSALYSETSVVWDCDYMYLSFGTTWQWNITFKGLKGHADSVISNSALYHSWLYCYYYGLIKRSLLEYGRWFISGGSYQDNIINTFVVTGSLPTLLENNFFKEIRSQVSVEVNGGYLTATAPIILDGGFVTTYRGQVLLIDPKYLGSFTVTNGTAPTGGVGWVKEAFTITPLVIDQKNNPISGATVIVTDKDDLEVANYTTNASGLPASPSTAITRQWVSAANTLTEFNPFRVIITKPGKIKKDFYMTLDRKFDGEIIMYNISVTGQEIL